MTHSEPVSPATKEGECEPSLLERTEEIELDDDALLDCGRLGQQAAETYTEYLAGGFRAKRGEERDSPRNPGPAPGRLYVHGRVTNRRPSILHPPSSMIPIASG